MAENEKVITIADLKEIANSSNNLEVSTYGLDDSYCITNNNSLYYPNKIISLNAVVNIQVIQHTTSGNVNIMMSLSLPFDVWFQVAFTSHSTDLKPVNPKGIFDGNILAPTITNVNVCIPSGEKSCDAVNPFTTLPEYTVYGVFLSEPGSFATNGLSEVTCYTKQNIYFDCNI